MSAPDATGTQRKYPRSWMQPFLDEYLLTGNLDRSAQAFLVNRRNIFFQVRHHPEFAAEFEAVRAVVAERIWSEVERSLASRN